MTDEVKKAVETLRYCEETGARCGGCPSGMDENGVPICHSSAHIADMIESLCAELEQVKQERDGLNILLGQAQSMLETRTRERDEAVEVVKELGTCAYCEHDSYCPHTIPDCMHCKDERCQCYSCGHQSKWQWRGVNTNLEVQDD